MKQPLIWIFFAFLTLTSIHGKAEPDKGHAHAKGEQHDHGDSSESEKDKDHDHDHGKEEEDAHGKASEHKHEESNDNVGPDKGIVEASEENGIKLSKEAFGNFGIKTQKLSGAGPWTIPSSARLFSGEEINLYRVRDQFIKRIDFKTIKTSAGTVTIQTSELKTGDEIVVGGIGFLRIAELVALGGAPEGHSH